MLIVQYLQADLQEEEHPLHQEQTDGDNQKTYCLAPFERTEEEVRSLAIDVKSHKRSIACGAHQLSAGEERLDAVANGIA